MTGFVVSHRLYTGALTVPICRSPFSRGFLALSSCLEKPPDTVGELQSMVLQQLS